MHPAVFKAMEARLQRRIPRGFTLVELLATMAVIALLAALLLPALGRAKLRARAAACAGNLRQIGIAMHGFAHDRGGRFPQQLSTDAGGALEPGRFPEPWWGQFIRSPAPFASLSNDLGNPRVLGCPAAVPGPASFANLKAAEVGYLAVLSARLGDGQAVLAVDRNLDPVRTRRITDGSAPGQMAAVWTPERHGGRGNALWGDGHVEFRGSLPFTPLDSAGAAPVPAAALTGRTIGPTALPAVAPAVRNSASRIDRLTTETPASTVAVGSGGGMDDEREARERRDRWIQRGLLWLILACMLLGLAAVLAHAWQRYRAIS